MRPRDLHILEGILERGYGLISSDAARAGWVDPDLHPLPVIGPSPRG